HPSGTQVTLFSNPCGSYGHASANMQLDFSDSATTQLASTCNQLTSGTYRPQQPLSPLLGAPASGTWSLKVANSVSQTVGTLNAWGLKIATVPTPVLVGHVTWQGHAGGSGQSLPLTLTLYYAATNTHYEYSSLTTDA